MSPAPTVSPDLHLDLGDGARLLGGDLVLHLHGLEHADGLTHLDRVAHGDEHLEDRALHGHAHLVGPGTRRRWPAA